MNNITPDTLLSFLSAVIGGIGGAIVSIPLNAYFTYIQKRDELSYKSRLDFEAKKRELLLQHKLEMIRTTKDDAKIANLIDRVERIEKAVWSK